MNPLSLRRLKLLKALVSQLQLRFPIEKIFCFSYGGNGLKPQSCFSSPGVEAPYGDYYHLLVVASIKQGCEGEIRQWIHSHLKEPVSIYAVVHTDIDAGNALEQGNRFFTTVYLKSILLYSEDPFLLPSYVKEVDWNSAYSEASGSWIARKERAWGLLKAATGLGKEYPEVIVSLLSGCLEQTLTSMIRVGMGYRLHTRSLKGMFDLCSCFSDLPAAFFPRDTEEENRIFGLLTRSFSAFRYCENYRIRAGDAVKLLERVKQFLEGIDKWCQGKLAELQRLAAAAGMD